MVLERADDVHVVLFVMGVVQVLLRVGQRNQVIQGDADNSPLVLRRAADDGVINEALDRAGDVHHIGLQFVDSSLANELGHFMTAMVSRVDTGHRALCIPDADMALWQQAVKRATNGFYPFAEHPVEQQVNLMFAAIANNALSQGYAVSADATEAAFGLRALHVNYNTHSVLALFHCCSEGVFDSAASRCQRCVIDHAVLVVNGNACRVWSQQVSQLGC
ncbi:hypothetical protein D3C76_1094680 [compost metagenome]